jgi:hypothetical protein
MSNYRYQTLHQTGSLLPLTKDIVKSPAGRAMDSKIALLNLFAVWANKTSVLYAVRRALKRDSRLINKLFVNNPCSKTAGVLIGVQLQESAHQDGAGQKVQMFNALDIEGWSPDVKIAFKKLKLRLSQYPHAYDIPRGWVRKTYYVWITPTR